MYQSKHLAPKTRKKPAASCRKRKLMLIMSAALLLSMAIGGTAAYFTDSEFSSSGFGVGKVSCAVSIAEDNSSVTVENTGNVPANIRVALAASWACDTEAGSIHYTQPTFSVDAEGWSEAEDGFYYYASAVEANTSLTLPICVAGEAPDGYSLQLQVLAEAIQENAAANAWEYYPGGN